ncbi:hypothetical protein F2Q69_00035007 [Brassica cretica]|uniref:Uncharacterized protein n=1 Tax=Brassica cretica TaxID=69181 RepID=A0A8S9SL66_BRACR|nr:hypothetical protein F2Q69_00035007 [Brassica cretica]
MISFDGRDQVAIELRLPNDHVHPTTVALVPFLVLSPSAFIARLIFSRILFWSWILISTSLAVGVQEEVLLAGHLGELASKEFGAQTRTENFAVCGKYAVEWPLVWWNSPKELSLSYARFIEWWTEHTVQLGGWPSWIDHTTIRQAGSTTRSARLFDGMDRSNPSDGRAGLTNPSSSRPRSSSPEI